MKILLLTTHLDIGGIGIYTRNLARYIKREGMDVAVASSGGDLAASLKEGGIEHFHLDIRTKTELGYKVWKALPQLVKLIKNNGFDLIHAQTRVAQVLACFAGKVTGIPFISTCHGFFKYKRLGRKLFPCWGSKVIAISRNVQEHLENDFNFPSNRIALIYNGIELERFTSNPVVKDASLMRNLGLSEDKKIVGTIGRLSSVKGQKYLLEAFKKILNKNEEAELLIVGEGPEKGRLKGQIKEMGLEGKVFFSDGTDAPLEKYLSLIDIFCLPSLEEGLGLSLMEAMAAGCACIASNIGGPSELIENAETGMLVPPGDSEALAEAMGRLFREDIFRKALAEKARTKALRDFAIEESALKTAEVYREVVSEDHGA